MKNGSNSPVNSISLKRQERKYIHMENKNISIDTFSTLANIGWALIFLKASGVTTQLPWNAILDYWLCLLAVSVILGLLTALIGWVNKVGGHSAK